MSVVIFFFLKRTQVFISGNGGFSFEKLSEYLHRLNPRIYLKVSGNGSSGYVQYNGVSIRVSDHEPNYGAPNRSKDYYIYTHDVGNKKLNDEIEVLQRIAEIYKLEITGSLKASVTRHQNQQVKNMQILRELNAKNETEYSYRREVKNRYLQSQLPIIRDNRQNIIKWINEANLYSQQGSNGDKRRKKRASYLMTKFRNELGLEMNKYKLYREDILRLAQIN